MIVMEELASDSSSVSYSLSNADIHLIQSRLLNQIKTLDEIVIDRDFLQVPAVCDDIRDKVLVYNDDPQLSKTHNNRRRIFIASELLVGVCSLHENNVNYELTNTVNNILDVEKFKNISRLILRYMHSQRCKENFFTKEIEGKMLKYSDDDRNLTEKTADKDRDTDHTVEDTRGQRQELSKQQFDENLDLPREDLVLNDPRQTIGNLTEVRDASAIHHTRMYSENIPQADDTITIAQPEVSIREPDIEHQTEQDISEILNILNDDFVREAVAEITRPEIPSESSNENLNAAENAVNEQINEMGEQHRETQEVLDDLNLSSLESDEVIKPKRPRVQVDEITVIPHYATRAVRLNRNINIQRVQVFEGPPKILQAVSVEYLMQTPGFRNSIFREKRNGMIINELYKRHLRLEKRPQETLDISQKRRRLKQSMTEEKHVLPIQARMDLEEECERTGMLSAPQRREVLSEIVPEPPTRLEDQVAPLFTLHPPLAESTTYQNNLNGIPLSRILRPTIESLPYQITAEHSVPTTPRIQNLQGKKLDAKNSKPWFTSTRVDPPSDKWRNFKFVWRKLEEYWALTEVQSTQKSITVLEFMKLEGDSDRANFLTLLRVLDKLSIQRKLLLEYKKEGIIIKPFEFPYVSNKQLLLRGKEPKF